VALLGSALLALLSLALHLILLMLALLGLAGRLLALAALLRLTLLVLVLRSALRLTGAALLVTRSRRATFHLRAALGRTTGLTARHLLSRRDGNSCQQRSRTEQQLLPHGMILFPHGTVLFFTVDSPRGPLMSMQENDLGSCAVPQTCPISCGASPLCAPDDSVELNLPNFLGIEWRLVRRKIPAKLGRRDTRRIGVRCDWNRHNSARPSWGKRVTSRLDRMAARNEERAQRRC
jgi:hypothetical protein